MDWKKISAFAPLISAAVVAGCIAVTLGKYEPPVYEVMAGEPVTPVEDAVQKEEEPDEKAAEEAKKNDTEGSFDLEDGIYRGVGNGYAGTITVSVEIKDKKIVAIEILDVEGDDAAFFNRAKGVIDKIISAQSTDVDVVSGATYSSRGIISAVKNALTGETDVNESPAASGSAGAGVGNTSVDYVDEPSAYRDGTYYGTGTGFGGALTVKVDISGGQIVSIQIIQHSDGSSYIQNASAVISRIISSQSTNVDTVSGATYSSVGIIEAVRNALSQAATSQGEEDQTQNLGNQNQDMQNPEEQKPQGAGNTTIDQVEEADSYRDGTYYGTGTGFGGSMKVKVDISDGRISDIQITEHKDGDEFIQSASSILQVIVSKQSTNVDTVSGATYSSAGIVEAVRDALKQAEITEDDTDHNNTNDNEDSEDPPQNAPAGMVPYADGIYFGTGEGYMGDITVAVVIQDKIIKAILIMENEADDEAFLERAKEVALNVVKQQNTDVDIVSGATYSSRGILEAIINALKEAERVTLGEENPEDPGEDDSSENPGGEEDPGEDDPSENPGGEENPGENDSSKDPGEEEPGNSDNEDSVYVDGEYSVQVLCIPDEDEDFEPYMLSLTMVIQGDQIISISDVQGDGDSDNDYYIKRAANGTTRIPGVLEQILEKNSTEGIDTVSRATCSSNAIIEGCNAILNYALRESPVD